jgi:NAD(P)-dependent dehydrogenase (short-subunit alcohol dehydrogenase family)
MNLKNKVALITGGGAGLGAAVAARFIADGAKVCISGRRKEVLEETAKAIGSNNITVCPGDVSNQEDVKRMVDTTVKFGGKLDVLLNNAGINLPGPVADLDPQTWQKVIGINLTGPFLTMKEAIPHMLKAGAGSIINIASMGGMRCLPGMPAYCASKGGLIMLTQQTALDYGKYNIRCNAVCPGGIKTEMVLNTFCESGRMVNIEPEAFITQIAASSPLRRFADPSEISGLCSFLASDDSLFMTGSAITIDGGATIVDVTGAAITAAMRKGGLVD